MLKETNNATAYSVDYRNIDNKTNKATSITRESKPKTMFSNTANNPRTVKDKRDIVYTDTNFDAITLAKPSQRKTGITRILLASIVMLAVVSVIMILAYALKRTATVMNNSPANAKYGNYLAPVVMHDPEPFEEITNIDTNTKIASCIWRNIFQHGASSYTEFDEQGWTLIPVTDIQSACNELFGPSAKIDVTENINGPFFSCAAGETCFHIGATSNANSLVPYIEDATEKKDVISLAVSYLSRNDKYFSADDDKTDRPSPVKRMIYNLKLNENTNKYYIQSIKTP